MLSVQLDYHGIIFDSIIVQLLPSFDQPSSPNYLFSSNMTPSHIQDDWVSIEFEQGLPQPRELDERAESQFKHQRLEKGKYFRLLRLHSNPVQGDFIHCRLQHFELESAPPYRAVSYVWGNSWPNRVIYIGDSPYREMEVSENLYTLLLCVRAKSDRWLWIDVLCINQSSKSERSHQIPLMGLIYSNANTVLGWLGPENHNIEQAFEFISKAAQYGVSNYCQSQHDSDEPVQFDNPFIITGMPGWQHDWRCFVHFAKLVYWTRRWIIQELVLAKSVVLQAGRQELSMDDVEKFLKILERIHTRPLHEDVNGKS
jgi:hypothetical protein